MAGAAPAVRAETLRTSEATLAVLDTRLGLDGLHVHTVRISEGEVRPGEEAEAVVEAERRAATARSHSATHVVHAMVRRLLGEHASQRGSRVEPGRLRFDYAHLSPVDTGLVQTLVNDYLLDDPEARVWETTRAGAEAAGAVALFGEKYGRDVRIVDIGDASRERHRGAPGPHPPRDVARRHQNLRLRTPGKGTPHTINDHTYPIAGTPQKRQQTVITRYSELPVQPSGNTA